MFTGLIADTAGSTDTDNGTYTLFYVVWTSFTDSTTVWFFF